MSKPKHTPGPWKAIKYQIVNAYMIAGPNVPDKIAEISKSTDCDGDLKANAQLIAAAPDLLDCLEQVFFNHGIEKLSPKLNDRILETIKKARGES